MSTLIDLTKVSVNFQLEFDTLDAILIVTTGGLGYLPDEHITILTENLLATLNFSGRILYQ